MEVNKDYMKNMRPAWLEIDLDGLASNVRTVRNTVGSDVKICASLKANAYGHGTIAVAQTFQECGVERFSVAIPDEGIELRRAGVTEPILVLGYSEPERAEQIVEYDLEQTVFNIDMARALSDEAVKAGKKAGIHIKFNTGMSRLGYSYLIGQQQIAREIEEIAALPGINLVGMFTHFALADDPKQDFTVLQFDRYMQLVDAIEQRNIHIPIRHCSNSAAILNYPKMHLDMVRTGVMLYCMPQISVMPMKVSADGCGEKSDIQRKKDDGADLFQIMSLKARISCVERLEPGMSVGYGRAFIAKKPTVIATLPLGYGDGYNRRLSCGNGEVLIHGKRAPIAGRICMDQFMVDVTGIDGVQKGDEAVMLGRQGTECIDVDELAQKQDTINYEVTCSMSRRLPRVYRKDGCIKGIHQDIAL